MFDIAANAYNSPSSLKPICPTRWLCRVQSVSAVLDQYAAVLSSLEEISMEASGEMATKAAALLDRFSDGKAVIGLKISKMVFGLLISTVVIVYRQWDATGSQYSQKSTAKATHRRAIR